jgi:hypothetical protein
MILAAVFSVAVPVSAVMVTLPVVAGAVKRPAGLMVPAEVDQVTSLTDMGAPN